MLMWFRILLFLLISTSSWAGLPPTRILDEGTDQGVAFKFDCVGAGISCTQSGVTGTLTVGAGSGGGWTDNGTDINLSTSTDNVGVGGASLGKLSVDGDTDEVQLLIQGNATQTSNILVIEQSDGTDILTGATGGIKVTGGIAATNLASCNTIDTDASGVMTCGVDSGGGGNSFETISVPAGTNPVADSSTDTLTITETTFLTITGTAGTDTIDITQVTTDIGTDGLIAANAVALGTDTTNNYVATIAGTASEIDVSGSGSETAAVTLSLPAAAKGWIDDGTEVRLQTSTDEVEIGSAAGLSAKLAVNGDADEIQALIQGNTTQTSDILVIENSAGTDILTGAVGGIKVTGAATVTQELNVDSYVDIDTNLNVGSGGNGRILITSTNAGPDLITHGLTVNNDGLSSAATDDFVVKGETSDTLFVVDASAETITSGTTGSIGWSVVGAANQACNTTCTSGCVVGFDTGLGGDDLVDCASAIADRCLCAGGS